jgi:predicted RecB family nuclease
MLVTEEVFRAFLDCETKAHLKFTGSDGASSEVRDWRSYLGEDFTRQCSLRLRSSLREDECLVGALPDKGADNRYRLVLDCSVQAQGLRSHFHALERIGSPGGTTHHPYVPVRFIPTEKITNRDKLLLAFDALVLSAASGQTPLFGKIIHGSEMKVTKVRVSELMKTTRSLVRRIAAQQANPSNSPVVLNKHCAECEFRSQCRQTAVEKDDLSLLTSMSEKERKKQRDKGIFTVTQFSHTFRPRRRSKRNASKPERYHPALKALAIREGKTYIAGRPEMNISGSPVYLDVEGVPDRDFYYLVGMRVENDGAYTQHSFWADELPQEKEIWTSFLQSLVKIKNPQLIHYGSYETVFLKRMKERYGGLAGDTAFLERLIAESVNLLSVIYAQVYFPTYSNGLKEIAQYLGFRWSDESASGLNSLLWREKWEHFRDPTLQQKLITYNAEDCEALEKVTATVSHLCRRGSEPANPRENVVHTDSLKLKSSYRFGENSFLMPELQKINLSAYWNYQRDKIYLRSNKRLRRVARQTLIREQKPLPVNTVVDCPAPGCCHACGSVRIRKHGTLRKVVSDLKFSRTGVRRWVVKYQFNRYLCLSCAATFNSQPQNMAKSKFGLTLLTYIVYQLVELKIPQGTVARSLNQLFDLRLHRNAVNKQKERAAAIYRDTYEGILKRILAGGLIHADETKVNIKRGSAYVWVLTNLEEVVYLYSDTREGGMIQSLLRDFRGVLVSDFYAAYDSINCPQQKCLIHLIRDLNDDLMKQPFNEGLKGLVRDFAELLKPITNTIDQSGLKTYFLRKHKVSVERFYKNLSRLDPSTDIVAKYKRRFEKTRGKLFTFLDHDGIPWNNNNAEHAIKAFAMLRNAIRGASSAKGIREYLTLLSICETCKYKGVSFLDFLRSGEKDIDEFIQNTPKSIRHAV